MSQFVLLQWPLTWSERFVTGHEIRPHVWLAHKSAFGYLPLRYYGRM